MPVSGDNLSPVCCFNTGVSIYSICASIRPGAVYTVAMPVPGYNLNPVYCFITGVTIYSICASIRLVLIAAMPVPGYNLSPICLSTTGILERLRYVNSPYAEETVIDLAGMCCCCY